VVAQRLIWWDIPIMIVATGLVWFFARDGHLSRGDGVGLLILLTGYLVAAVRISTGEPEAVREEYEKEFSATAGAGWRGMGREIFLMVAGLGLLVGGASVFVDGAIGIARSLGLSELIISLTIVAVGTSLPELVTAMVAASRGENDIAVGNVVGSNIMNLLAILGLTALIAPGGLAVPAAVLSFDLPVLLVASIACLPFLGSRHRLSRVEGVLFLMAYVGYVFSLLYSF
jgi:cation:H+ antiporter